MFPDPKAMIDAAARRSLQGRAARRDRRQDADRARVARSVHGAAAAERPHAGRQVAGRSAGRAATGRRTSRCSTSASTAGGPIRATASTRRRASRAIACTGKARACGGPNERPFALHRNGHAGMQRYGAFLWSGDVFSTWETLKTHVPVAINTGLQRHSVLGHRHRRLRADDGADRRAVRPLVSVRARSVRCSARTAAPGICACRGAGTPAAWSRTRSSATTGGAANPDASELHNAAVEPICRKYLELRYRLMPYLYTAVREAHDTGLPIMRALWLHYPDDRGRGRARRSVPVGPRHPRRAGRREGRDVAQRLPARRAAGTTSGRKRRHDGGREIARAVDLETMPLYVRAGAILPLGPVKQYTAEPSRRAADAAGLSRRRRHVHAVRGRRAIASTTSAATG